MPLIYHINGVPTPFDSSQVIHPVSPGFASTLSLELEKKSTSSSAAPHPPNESPIPSAYSDEDLDKKRKRHNRDRKPALVAQDIMTKKVITISADLTLADARMQMNHHRIRHLPVTDNQNIMIGILSDRDILLAGEKIQQTISTQMTPHVLTATPDTLIREIAGVMIQKRIHALPIVNIQKRIVGIVSTSDLLQAIVNLAPIELWT